MMQPVDGRRSLARRELLWLAGGVGIAAVAAACGGREPQRSDVAPPATPQAALPVERDVPPAPPPIGTSVPLLCREAWGARPAKPGGVRHTINRLTIHHTAVVLGDNRLAPERLRQHQRLHQDERGWIDIAYHISVDRNGNIYELRSPELVGDTATEYDPTGHFLLLCEGNFEEESVSEEQLRGAALVLAWAAQTYHVPTETLATHRDFASTACPGENLYEHVTSGDLKRRIDAFVAAGPVALNLVCGPEADAAVADIVAGRNPTESPIPTTDVEAPDQTVDEGIQHDR